MIRNKMSRPPSVSAGGSRLQADAGREIRTFVAHLGQLKPGAADRNATKRPATKPGKAGSHER
jgi:hypothetical protein